MATPTTSSRHPRAAAPAPLLQLVLLGGCLAIAAPLQAEGEPDERKAASEAETAAEGGSPRKPTRKTRRDPLKITEPGNAVNPTDASLYVGSTECLSCHEDDEHADMRATAHLPLFLEGRYPAHLSGCEACHGPGAAHAEAGRKSKIRRLSELTAGDRSRICLQCHGGDAERQHYRRSAHDAAQVACDSCHVAHSTKDEVQTETCQGCHPATIADFALPFRHRVPEGAMKCSDCHAQHGAAGRQLRHDDADQVCAKCHAEQAGPYVYEHLPRLFGGCTSCHAPHGSANRRQLIRDDARSTCLECHVNTPESHDQAETTWQNCLTCHVQVHGSNIDPTFQE